MSFDFLKVTNQSDASKPARLDLFGQIGGDFWSPGIDEGLVKAEMAGIADDQPIDVYINSVGGSVFTALAIYNLLKRHQGPIRMTVAGLAASAATIITSVPNATVVMPKGSMMLVHPVRQSANALTPEEMQEAATNLEKIRLAVRDIYEQKTGMDTKRLDDMMGKESFLTAAEAVELGFADMVDESQVIENVMLGDTVTINGLAVNAQMLAHAPIGFVKETQSPKKEEKVHMNLETFKAQYPEMVEAIRKEALQEGIHQERARIEAIEDIAVAGHADLVQDAKFKTIMTAESLAVAILKADKARSQKMLSDREKDAQSLIEIEPDGNEGIDLNAKANQKAHADRVSNLKNLCKYQGGDQ